LFIDPTLHLEFKKPNIRIKPCLQTSKGGEMGTEDDTGELSERVKALETLIAFFIGNMEEFDPIF